MLDNDIIPEQGLQVQACADGDAALENKLYDDAITYFNKAIDQGACKEACLGLAQVYNAQNDSLKAVKILTDAIKIDRFFHPAFLLLGDIYYASGQGVAAIESYAQAVAIDPVNDLYKQKLIRVVGALDFKKINPNLKGVLLECLESNNIEFIHFGRSWLSVVSSDPLIAQIYKLSKHNNYDAFKKSMDLLSGYDGLIEPFFLTGLGKFIVPEIVFERWCTYLRRFLLEAISSGAQLFTDPEDIELMSCALSKYAFLTDYIFECSEPERVLLKDLQAKIEKSNNPDLAELGILGCYVKLCGLSNANEIAAALQGGDHVSQIPKSQIEDYFTQLEIKKQLPELTKIKGSVSSAVQEQYEEFPYPRWDTASNNLYNADIECRFKGRKAKILNAGCGTGKEAVQMAYIFPDAQITAIDLSRSSLAYAQHKADQRGIKNIKFMQADIMELGSIEDRFDFIASSGVLHHMDDPKAGWKILDGLLNPDGVMRIALYSSKARWAVNDAIKIIGKGNIASDAASIKDFRKNISDYLKYKSIKNIANFYDYYSLPECRDLLFHVQEHQFTLPQIKDVLDELDLEFLQMSMPNLKKYQKRNPDDMGAKNLDALAKWEDKNPDTFVAMYVFWCQKNG